MPEQMARVLVVDDEERIQDTLRKSLERGGYVVATASSGEEALELLRESSVDAAVIDLNLGGHVDGLRVVEAMRWRWPETAIIILTAHGSLSSAIRAIREDVDDYLLKPSKPSQVREALEQALERRAAKARAQAAAKQRVLERGAFRIDLERYTATRDGQELELTPQEFKLLAHLMQNAGRVAPPPELVRVVRGYETESMHEARSIVKWYVHRLRQRVEPDPSSPRHILNVRGVGYRFME
jgi:DNA-binding response OmpR family regulator